MALFLMGALIWTALDLRRRAMPRPARLTGWGAFALAVLFVQLMLGAWVAGFRAGYVVQHLARHERPLLPRRDRLVAMALGSR